MEGPSRHDEELFSWHDAAQAASFEFYEPVADVLTGAWAGGFGWDDQQVSSLSISAEIDGVEVEVETSTSPVPDPVLRRRVMLSELVWDLLLDERTGVELPMSFTIRSAPRTLAVDDESTFFDGVQVEGGARWIGVSEVRGVNVKVTASGATELGLRRCIDWRSLPSSPPRADET